MRNGLTAIAGVVLLSQVADAGVVEYRTDDRDEWFADVGGAANVSTVDFTGYEDFTPVSDQWSYLGVEFSGTVFTSGESNFAYPNDGWGMEGYPDINVSFDEPISWIAIDFPGVAEIELFADGTLIYASEEFGVGGTGFFGGLISDVPFDQARIFRTAISLTVVDDLHFGAPINVPAPGALMAVGLGLLARRRRSRDA